MNLIPIPLLLCWSIGLVAAAWASTGPTLAQNYPNRPIRIVVPFAAGGAVDTVGRIVAAKMADHLGQPVIVENRTGAGGNIGADAVAKSAPDGYTLLLTTSGHAITPALYRAVPYDAVKDFTPVSQVLATTFVLVASPKLPVNSIAEVIALAKSKPGGLNYGSSGLGAPLHLAMEVFKHSAGIDVQHIPYRGDAPVNAALIGGEIQLAFVPQSTGLPGYGTNGWFSVVVAAGTPRPIIDKLNGILMPYLSRPDVQDRLNALAITPLTSTPDELEKFIPAEIEKWAKVVKDAGIEPQ